MIIEIDVIENLSKEIDFLYSELSEDQQEYQVETSTLRTKIINLLENHIASLRTKKQCILQKIMDIQAETQRYIGLMGGEDDEENKRDEIFLELRQMQYSLTSSDNIGLIPKLERLKTINEYVLKKHQLRVNTIKDIYEKIEECKRHLGTTLIDIEPFDEKGEEIISTKRIQNLTLYVKKFIEIKESRLVVACELRDKIINLWDELGVEPQDDFDRLIENFNKNKFYVTTENMEKLRIKCEQLEEEKSNRKLKVDLLLKMINVLWDKMQISNEEREEIEGLTGYHIDTLKKYENELIRLNKMKKKYMKSFILKCKLELDNYWKMLYFSKEQQQQFYNKYPFIDFDESNINSLESEEESTNNEKNSGEEKNEIEKIISTMEINQKSCINEMDDELTRQNENEKNENGIQKGCLSSKKYSDEEILAAYEKEIVKMEKLYEEAKDVLELVGKHIRLVEEVKNFEISCADQTRLFQKGKRDPGRLLREEKFRKRIARERPKLEKELIKILSDWEIQNRKPFTIYGKRYLDSIKTLDDEVSKLVMNEKEKHKSKSHSKNTSIEKNVNTDVYTPHKKKIPKTPNHKLHSTKIKRQRTNSNEINENDKKNDDNIVKTPKKNIPNTNDWNNTVETPKTDRMLLDTQKLLYTTSRIPNTPVQNLPTKNYPMSARSHSRIPMLNLKNNYKKTNLFSIALPQKRKFYFSDDEDNEEKREIFENFAKKSKDLNEILQKFKKDQVKSSSTNTTTTTTVTTNTTSSSTLNDSKTTNTLLSNTYIITPSNLTNSDEIAINNNNQLSCIEEISSNQAINNNNNSSSDNNSNNNSSNNNHSNNNRTTKYNSNENSMNNNGQQSHSDPFIMKKESKNLNQHCNTCHQNDEITTSHISKNNKNTKNCNNNSVIQVEIDDQLQSIQAIRSPTKSKIKTNTIKTSSQEEKENLSIEMNVQKDFSQDKKKVIDKSEIENFSHPLTMNNTHINLNMSTNNVTRVNTQSHLNTNSTTNETKSKILPSFNITKMSQSQSIAKDIGTFMSPSPKKQMLTTSTLITSDKKKKSQNSNKSKNNNNKNNNSNSKNNNKNSINNKSNDSSNSKKNEGALEPLKKVKQEEEEEENVITVATPLMTITKEGQEVVKEYQYEKINLAEPSALTIKIKNQNIPGIGDIGDQSLSSIDGEEGVDSFIDDIIF